jgi:hypothetical protein
MSVTVEEIMPTLTATKVLISILESLGKAEVPLSTFTSMQSEDRELEVNYNGDTDSIIFSLKKVDKEDEQ